MPRFTIVQHHWQGIHWDLFLESNDSLLTWELTSEPCASSNILAHTKPNHRLKYLDYEGKISGNRGYITQWDTGNFSWKTQHEGSLSFTLKGTKLKGEATLKKLNDSWVFHLTTESDQTIIHSGDDTLLDFLN